LRGQPNSCQYILHYHSYKPVVNYLSLYLGPSCAIGQSSSSLVSVDCLVYHAFPPDVHVLNVSRKGVFPRSMWLTMSPLLFQSSSRFIPCKSGFWHSYDRIQPSKMVMADKTVTTSFVDVPLWPLSLRHRQHHAKFTCNFNVAYH